MQYRSQGHVAHGLAPSGSDTSGGYRCCGVGSHFQCIVNPCREDLTRIALNSRLAGARGILITVYRQEKQVKCIYWSRRQVLRSLRVRFPCRLASAVTLRSRATVFDVRDIFLCPFCVIAWLPEGTQNEDGPVIVYTKTCFRQRAEERHAEKRDLRRYPGEVMRRYMQHAPPAIISFLEFSSVRFA